MRIVQISDTHISPRHQQFNANLAAIRQWLASNPCDLIVNTGDLSMNGAVSAEDLEAAAAWHVDLGAPCLTVPGNHDVGDMPDLRADQVIDDGRLSRFRGMVGEDRWIHDQAGWRLVGLNAMLLGTGHPDEEEQYDWLAGAVDSPDPIALFLHKPLFVDDPAEGPLGYWTVRPAPRRRVLDILARSDIRLVASGHLHVARIRSIRDVSHVWGPSAAFVCGSSQGREVPGERRIGVVVHDFTLGDVSSRIVFLDRDGAENLTIDPHLAAIYPSPLVLEPTRA